MMHALNAYQTRPRGSVSQPQRRSRFPRGHFRTGGARKARKLPRGHALREWKAGMVRRSEIPDPPAIALGALLAKLVLTSSEFRLSLLSGLHL
jgi:hypothetical protein